MRIIEYSIPEFITSIIDRSEIRLLKHLAIFYIKFTLFKRTGRWFSDPMYSTLTNNCETPFQRVPDKCKYIAFVRTYGSNPYSGVAINFDRSALTSYQGICLTRDKSQDQEIPMITGSVLILENSICIHKEYNKFGIAENLIFRS
jgi:hypothetical protein